jgi:hypothetical protein
MIFLLIFFYCLKSIKKYLFLFLLFKTLQLQVKVVCIYINIYVSGEYIARRMVDVYQNVLKK